MRTRIAALVFFGLLVLVALGAVVAGVLALRDGRGAIAGLCFGVAVFLFVLRPRPLRERDEGVVVSEAALVHALGRGREVRVTLDPEVRADERTLWVGVPLLAALDEPALRALVEQQLVRRRDPRWVATPQDGLRLLAYLRGPLRWYGRAFARVTRAEDERADRAADAQVADRAALARALAALPTVIVVWERYWEASVTRALDRGVHPPIVEGFAALLVDEEVRPYLELDVDEVHRSLQFALLGEVGPRVTALGGAGEPWPRGGDPALRREAALFERSLLARIDAEDEPVGVTWAEIGPGPDADEPVPRRPPAPVTVRLLNPVAGQAGALVGTAVVVGLLLVFALAFVVVAVDPATEGGRGIAWGLVAVTVAAAAYYLRRGLSRVGRPGTLTVDGAQLVVHQPRMLQAPLEVPLGSVQAVAVTESGDARFPVRPDSVWRERAAAPLGHVWDRHLGSPPGLLDLAQGAPNVVVVLVAPVAVPPARLRARIPRLAVARGLLLRVDDPAAVRAAGAGDGLVAGDLHALRSG